MRRNVLDVLLQRQRDAKAAELSFRKLLEEQGFVPRSVTDELKVAAAKETGAQGAWNIDSTRLNNRAEFSPTDSVRAAYAEVIADKLNVFSPARTNSRLLPQ